jgi:CelD/BcsL family acetyltransferase involved in cellulose biosynthesis
MRANLKRGERKMLAAGMNIDHIAPNGSVEDVLNRVLNVEQHTWKRKAGQSVLLSPRYHAFYQSVLERAASRGALRASFITRDGVDLAYIFGAVLGHTYRGFQLGFHEDFTKFGLGNQAQLAMIQRLCTEGIQWYDLGMSMEYKQRWSDRVLELSTVVVIRHS